MQEGSYLTRGVRIPAATWLMPRVSHSKRQAQIVAQGAVLSRLEFSVAPLLLGSASRRYEDLLSDVKEQVIGTFLTRY